MYFRAGMGCPDAVLKATKALFDGAREWHLAPERFAEFDAFMATASQLGHELRAYDDAIDFVAGQRDAVRRNQSHRRRHAVRALTGWLSP